MSILVTPMPRRALGLAAHLGHRLLHLFGTDIALMGRHRPAMAQRILELGIPITPERGRYRHSDFCSGSNSLRHDGIDIFDV
jgi:hypothetical protein